MRLYRVTATMSVDMMVYAEDPPQARALALENYSEQFADDDPEPFLQITPVVSPLNAETVVPGRWFDRVPWSIDGANDACATVRELVKGATP